MQTPLFERFMIEVQVFFHKFDEQTLPEIYTTAKNVVGGKTLIDVETEV